MGRANEALQAALAQLVQGQVALVQNQLALAGQHTVLVSQMAEIRREFEEIKAVPLRHERILHELPETIKRTIGFKVK
jgi:hypothetical protein